MPRYRESIGIHVSAGRMFIKGAIQEISFYIMRVNLSIILAFLLKYKDTQFVSIYASAGSSDL